ncbi:hypothetical protein SBRCBS47491_006388 [Sporothrix bragantina]|uniref:DUF4246 domain-containing protein n=1 Tax=Sporothrix bragantina TaxID=671064 RepID=A0ABP0C6Y2_9PEZI
MRPENPLAAQTQRYEPNLQIKYLLSFAARKKHDYIKAWEHPELGVAFTYEQWKAGHATAPVVSLPEEEYIDLAQHLADHENYTVSLEKMFRRKGLQVVVEIGSLELRAGAIPPQDPWKLTGTLNDHIVATAAVYFGSENVTTDSAAFDFRVEAGIDPPIYDMYQRDSKPYHPAWPLADIYGIMPEPAPGEVTTYAHSPSWTQHGPAGDKVLKLHLVNPNCRVVSTRNVTPQQREWWQEAGWDRISWAKPGRGRGLPPELVSMIGPSAMDTGPS